MARLPDETDLAPTRAALDEADRPVIEPTDEDVPTPDLDDMTEDTAPDPDARPVKLAPAED